VSSTKAFSEWHKPIDSDVHSKPLERDDDEIELFSYVMEGRWSLAFANLCWFRDMQMPKPTTHLPSCGTLANDFRMSTLQGCWGLRNTNISRRQYFSAAFYGLDQV